MIDDDAIVPDDEIQKVKPPQYNKLFPVKKTSDDAITPDDKPSDTLLELLENGHKENGHKKDVKEIERKLVFENLSCVKPHGVKLRLCYGEFLPGQIVAITGPSRSGRSTLMKILAGVRIAACRGRITVDGRDRTNTHFRTISTYIPHHLILDNLTVKETLRCAAVASCPTKFSSHERRVQIIKIIQLLLNINQLHSKVYDLSLAEQRVLCLAAEYLRSPKYMFIQDPLDKLDIPEQLYYLSKLKALTSLGVTIVLCMKSGASNATLEFIDQLVVLNRGEIVYSGPPSNLCLFFKDSSLDPSYPDIQQVLTHCALRDTKEQALENRERSTVVITSLQSFQKYDPEPSGILKHTLQGFSMCSRYAITLARQVRAVAYRLIYYTVLGVLMGGICFEVGRSTPTARENAGYLFFSMIFLFISAMVASARRTNRYMCIYQREKFNLWYSPFSFYIAKMLAELPVEVIMSVPFASTTYFLAGNPANLVFFVHMTLSVMTALLGHVFGVVVMAISQKFEIQQTVAGMYVVSNAIISGYLFRVEYMPVLVRWAAILSPFNLLFKCLYTNIYSSKDPLLCPITIANCSKHAADSLGLYGFSKGFEGIQISYVFGHLLLLHVIAYVFISARGRWFDTELPHIRFNKRALPPTGLTPPASNHGDLPEETTTDKVKAFFRSLKCRRYKPIHRDSETDDDITPLPPQFITIPPLQSTSSAPPMTSSDPAKAMTSSDQAKATSPVSQTSSHDRDHFSMSSRHNSANSRHRSDSIQSDV